MNPAVLEKAARLAEEGGLVLVATAVLVTAVPVVPPGQVAV